MIRLIRRRLFVNDVLTDATSASMSDPTGSFGVRRDDTEEIVVAANVAMTHVATGVYEYEFTDLLDYYGPYTAYVKFTYGGASYYFEHDVPEVDGSDGADTSTGCSSLAAVEPGSPVHEGCPILVKQQVLVVDKGVASTVSWTMRARNGEAADITACLLTSVDEVSSSISDTSDGGSVLVRFASCDEKGNIYEVTGVAVDAANGLVSFQLPSEVYNTAGIWKMQIAVTNSDSVPVLLNSGMVSVERGLFGDLTNMSGPPTLNEIRIHIRDTAVENDLLMDVEFDDTEIIAALVRPVQYWNETSPHLRRFVYNCNTFPWRMHWLNGIVGQLLRTASHSYMRNKMQVTHGGVQVNDRDKNTEYMQMSTYYWDEFTEFVIRKKVELNARQMFGTVGSDYD